MKECPQCKRTYADETITFCLVDGAILSAPYTDVPPTQEAPAPTVRLPHTTRPQVPETIPAQAPPLRTPPPSPAMRRSERSRSIYIVIALVVLLLGGLITLFALKTRRANQSQQRVNVNISTSPSDRAQSETDSRAASDKTAQPNPSHNVSPPAIKNPKLPPAATIEIDPRLSPAVTPTPGKREASTDENKVFRANEVTQKARLLSKPLPSYTEEARKNQIAGTVVLRVVLAASGKVTNITPIKGLPDGLTERAIAAARQIRFEPAMKDGRAVSQYIQIEYNFSLY